MFPLLLVSAFASNARTLYSNVTPVCVSEDDTSQSALEDEKASMPLGFVPFIYYGNSPRYGYQTVKISQPDYDEWINHCAENQSLVARMDDWNGDVYLPFETEIKPYRIHFVKDKFHNSATYGPGIFSRRIFSMYQKIYDLLVKIAALSGEHQTLSSYLKNNQDFTISLFLHPAAIQTPPPGENMMVGIFKKGTPYVAENNLQGSFTIERLVIHQLVYKISSADIDEPEVIRITNDLLQTLGYPDLPRESIAPSHVESTVFGLSNGENP